MSVHQNTMMFAQSALFSKLWAKIRFVSNSSRLVASLGLFLLVSTLLGCAAGRQAAEFKTRWDPGKSVSLMPITMQYFKRTFSRDEPFPERDSLAVATVEAAFHDVLGESKFTVRSARLGPDDLDSNPALRAELGAQNADFQRVLAQIKRTDGPLKVTLRPETRQFAERAKTDYLIFVSGTGFETSGGKKGKDIITSIVTNVLFGATMTSQWKGTLLHVALVDGHSGDVLWYNTNRVSESEFHTLTKGDMKILIRMLLKPLKKRG